MTASLKAEVAAVIGPGNVAGQPATWPVPRVGELFARPEPSPECYLRQTSDGEAWQPRTCLPGFLVIGPQKTGTSALYQYLKTHPQTEINSKKELLHWGPGPNAGRFSCNATYRDSYLSDFVRVPPEGDKITGDFSATDIACSCCPTVVHQLLPKVKLIVLLRDPIARAQSRYMEQYSLSTLKRDAARGMKVAPAAQGLLHAVLRDGLGCDLSCQRGTLANYVNAKLPILERCLRGAPSVRRRSECVQADQILGWSMYDTMINNWLEFYPLEQLMLVKSSALDAASTQNRSEAALARTRATLAGVLQFLGLRQIDFPTALLRQGFNTAQGYGWQDSSRTKEKNHTVAGVPEVDGSCDAACKASAVLAPAIAGCLSVFYNASIGAFDFAGKVLQSTSDFCHGNSCAFHPMVVPTSEGAFDAAACLAEVEAQSRPTRMAGWVHIPKAGTAFVNTVSHWLDEEGRLPPNAGLPVCDSTNRSAVDLCERHGFSDLNILQTFSTM